MNRSQVKVKNRGLALWLITVSLGWMASSEVVANVFGDGNPDNGIEDGRIALPAATRGTTGSVGAVAGGGTIHCEGLTRGSATVLDPGTVSASAQGLFLATAAHVLWDLERGQRFEDCEFRYQGMAQIPGYQFDLESARILSGEFDPSADPGNFDFGREDWAFIYLPPTSGSSTIAQKTSSLGAGSSYPVRSSQSMRDKGQLRYFLLAFDDNRESMSISADCEVIESGSKDLGGGSWPGQLLDNCDSGSGASGGGLLAEYGGRAYLVGIRTGAHWSAGEFPPDEFPQGPPEGSRWDVTTNTNFARAVDEQLLEALRQLAVSLGH